MSEQITEVVIDLMQRKIVPPNVIFNDVIACYSEKFYEQIENRTMNLNFVASVRIFCQEISFQKIQCQLIILDDLGVNHIAEKTVNV